MIEAMILIMIILTPAITMSHESDEDNHNRNGDYGNINNDETDIENNYYHIDDNDYDTISNRSTNTIKNYIDNNRLEK